MKLKGILFSMLLSVLFCSCGNKPRKDVPDSFRMEKILKTTPVKDRGMSPVGWCCAMLDVIETEHLMQGDSVNLSFDYVVRCYLRSQAEEYCRSKGSTDITAAGIAPMVPLLLRRYGCLPYDSYNNIRPVNYNVLVRKMKLIADTEMAKRSTEEEFMKSIDNLLDSEIGYLPKAVFMFRMQYTPVEFAGSVCGRDEYQTLMPTQDGCSDVQVLLPHEYNTMNITGKEMPNDSLFSRIRRSIHDGHAVMWTSNVSSDDAFALVGIGRDRGGNEFFVAKDSRGNSKAVRGWSYIPASYVKSHTAFAVMQKHI